MIFFATLFAFILDRLFAEPRRHHPLVYFGRYSHYLERTLNSKKATRLNGVVAYLLATAPLVLLAIGLENMTRHQPLLHLLLSALLLYVAIGWQSLLSHAQAIITPLKDEDLDQARHALAMIVSRDTEDLNEEEISKAATESVLENGADSIFSALFWFLLLGMPGVVLYRCSNTLDAMWGYKTERFLNFGWCAARIDDLLNFIPARLTALSYALMGNYIAAMRYWKTQGSNWKSPNAGPVMAAGAGALDVSLGGDARYHGVTQPRQILGPPKSPATIPNSQSIQRACTLVTRSVLLWLTIIALVSYL